jgi:PleD family two-component response regulator
MNKKNTILIVDDSEFDRQLVHNALSKKGRFKVIEANSGNQCLEIVESQKIDLILMDIMMPGTYGTQILEKIREKFNPIELPIIMITAKSDATDIIGSLQNGANDYITKPVNFSIAICRILTHLQLAELSHEMSRLKGLAALDAMISTYNHEINNPLAIAVACLNKPNWTSSSNVEKLKAALWRVGDIVKKIRAVTEKKEIEYEDYTKITKMVKIK